MYAFKPRRVTLVSSNTVNDTYEGSDKKILTGESKDISTFGMPWNRKYAGNIHNKNTSLYTFSAMRPRLRILQNFFSLRDMKFLTLDSCLAANFESNCKFLPP